MPLYAAQFSRHMLFCVLQEEGAVTFWHFCLVLYIALLWVEVEKWGGNPPESLGALRLLAAIAPELTSPTNGLSQASVAAKQLLEFLCRQTCALC